MCIRDRITTEANPDSAREVSALRQLREAGFNRISLGMQSASDDELRLICLLYTSSSFSCTIFSDIVCCLLSNGGVATSFYQRSANHVSFYPLVNLRNLFYLTLLYKKTGETSNYFSRLLDLMCIRVSHYVSTVKCQSLKRVN